MAVHKLPASWVIVGAGFYPWLVALFLQKKLINPLQHAGRQPISLTLVQQKSTQPDRVITTTSALRHFNKSSGLSEADFVRACQACFNLGTLIQGPSPLQAKPPVPAHPFFFAEGPYGFMTRGVRLHHLLACCAERLKPARLDDFSVAAQLALQNRFTPPSTQADSLFAALEYGYRFSASDYTAYLSKLVQGDLNVYSAGLSRVVLDSSQGGIAALELDNGHRVSGDFYIDVSEKRLLKSALSPIGQRGKAGYPVGLVNCAHLQARDQQQSLKPYQHLKLAQGEVSLASTSHEQGYHHQLVIKTSDEKTRNASPSKVFWDPEPWQDNCVALGPALSNRPPLIIDEVHTLLYGLHELARFWPVRDATATNNLSKKWFNRKLAAEGEQLFDIDSLYLHASFAHLGVELSHGAKDMRDLFCETGTLPAREHQTLAEPQWIALLYAVGAPLKFDNILARQFDADQLVNQLIQLRQSIQQASKAAPLHEDFLRLNRLTKQHKHKHK